MAQDNNRKYAVDTESYAFEIEGKRFRVEYGFVRGADAFDPLTLKACSDRIGISFVGMLVAIKIMEDDGIRVGSVLFDDGEQRLFCPFR